MTRQPFWNLKDRFVAIENTLHAALVRHGITALRVTVGMIFLGFGLLKFFLVSARQRTRRSRR